MALQLVFEDSFGGTNLVAYARVTEVVLVYRLSRGRIHVDIFRDELSRRTGKIPLQQVMYDLVDAEFLRSFSPVVQDVGGVNPVQTSYQYLKTLPEYASAIDV